MPAITTSAPRGTKFMVGSVRPEEQTKHMVIGKTGITLLVVTKDHRLWKKQVNLARALDTRSVFNNELKKSIVGTSLVVQG